MATYKKVLKTIAIKTLGGTEKTVADTATDAKASNALAEFEDGKTVHADGTVIPFHAIDSIVVTQTSTDVEKADPYGCEE